MIANTLRWFLHWFGQGLKLWIFTAMASVCVVPIYLPLGLLERYHFDEVGALGQCIMITGYIACCVGGVAVFTAVLAGQLNDHPLRSFTPLKKHEKEPDEEALR